MWRPHTRSRRLRSELVPAVAQVVTEQVVKAVGQVPVPFIFDTGFRVGGLLFALGPSSLRSW